MYEDIPIGDPVNHLIYAFAFDRDGNTANNVQSTPDHPYNETQDTDYLTTAMYDPTYGWRMYVVDLSNNSSTIVESNARMIITGNASIVFIPQTEFLANTIGYRYFTYQHLGDYGLDTGVWDIDVLPPVNDGLYLFELTD
jgi:hypothetical protein